MRYLRIIAFFLGLQTVLIAIFASTPVAENISFELGNFKNWTGSSWIYSIYPDMYPSTTPVSGTDFGRHIIISNTSYTDPNTDNKLLGIPPGYKHAARLGNSATGCHHQSLSYKLLVDEKNPLLIWRFAVVMQNPIQKHTEETKPYFKISIKDNQNTPVATCTEYSVISDMSLPGFNTYYPPGYDPADSLTNSGISPVLWRDWTAVGINLSDYIGKEITLEFTSADCAQGGHYCYAYFVAECKPLQLTVDFCANETQAVLTAPEGFMSYKWLTPDNKLYYGRTLYVPNPIERANYSCSLISEMGCSATIKSQIYHFNPVINFVGNTVNCDSNIVQFNNLTTFVDNDYLKYEWDFGDGIISTEKNPIHRFITNGKHNVNLTVGSEISSCKSYFSKQVDAFSKSNVKLVGENTYCKGNKTTLTASGAIHYLWNTGDTTATIDVGEDNVYWVRGFSEDRNCFSEPLVMQVSQEPEMDVKIEGNAMICNGDSVLITASGALSYLWDTGEKTAGIYIKEGRKYQVECTNSRGCTKTYSFTADKYNYPLAGFNQSASVIDIHHNLIRFNVMQPEPNVNYEWNFGDGTTASGSSVYHYFNIVDDKPFFDVELKAVNIADCKTYNTQKINIEPFIPNVFSPNSDGKNDLFMPGFNLQIFDRNGMELYNGTTGWDGKYAEKAVAQDTYFYIIRYISYEMKDEVRKGYVTLLK